MHPPLTNSSNDALIALEAALRIIENKSRQKAEDGATIWIKLDGKPICVRISPDDAALIPGASYIGGTCAEAITKTNTE